MTRPSMHVVMLGHNDAGKTTYMSKRHYPEPVLTARTGTGTARGRSHDRTPHGRRAQMRLFGLVEVTSAPAARKRDEELAALREAAGAVEGAVPSGGRPPAVAQELIVVADRLADLVADSPLPPERSTAALHWMQDRVQALLALCQVAPIIDEGAVDFLRHEVVGDRPAPAANLIDHIAETVRPGYRWGHELVRAQEVVAYVPGPTTANG